MKDTLRIVVLTLVVFGAGLLTGIWTQHIHRFPSPPMGPLGEISPDFRPWGHDFSGHPHFPMSAEKAAEIQAEMDKIRPEVEAFQQKLRTIESDFRTKLEAMLTPDQRKLMPPAPPLPGDGDKNGPFQFGSHFQGPLEGLAIFTIITPLQEFLTTNLKLTDAQQATLKQLLLDRRQRFLELVDATPPPSLKLGRLMLPPPSH